DDLGALLSDPTASADGVGRGRFMDLPRFMDAAIAAVEAEGGSIRTGLAADSLLLDRGSVVGLKAGAHSVRARSVLLAGGGFQASQDMVSRYIHPNGRRLLLRSNPHSAGAGFRLALEAGAVPSKDLDGFYGHLICWPIDAFDPAGFMD